MQTTLMLPTGGERVEDPPFHITLDTYAHFLMFYILILKLEQL